MSGNVLWSGGGMCRGQWKPEHGSRIVGRTLFFSLHPLINSWSNAALSQINSNSHLAWSLQLCTLTKPTSKSCAWYHHLHCDCQGMEIGGSVGLTGYSPSFTTQQTISQTNKQKWWCLAKNTRACPLASTLRLYPPAQSHVCTYLHHPHPCAHRHSDIHPCACATHTSAPLCLHSSAHTHVPMHLLLPTYLSARVPV